MNKNHVRLIDRTPENDIKYRGPLSYRTLRIVGWVCLALSQVSIMLGIVINVLSSQESPDYSLLTGLSAWSTVFSFLGAISVSLFLVANFALILQSRDNIKRLVLIHLLSAIGLYLVFVLLYRRYLYGFFHVLFKDNTQEALDSAVTRVFSRHLSFNIFIDLLLCSSMYFFLTYTPKKLFQGKKIVFFRLFAIAPAAYELVCLILKGLGEGCGLFSLPVILIPLFPTKPFFTFLAFLGITLFVKFREKAFRKEGKSKEEYQRYLDTNANSLSFSLFIAGAFFVAGLADLLSAIGVTILYTMGHYQAAQGEGLTFNQFYLKYISVFLNAWGLGKAVDLWVGAPIVLLFSYTKRHSAKSKIIDLVLPIAGLALCAIVYLEGFLALSGMF